MSNRDMSETTMALLGKLIPPGTGRDAIHIAVAPAARAYNEMALEAFGEHARLNEIEVA